MDDPTKVRREAAAHSVLRCLSDALIAVGAEGRVALANPAAEALLGAAPDGLLGGHVRDVLHCAGPSRPSSDLHAIIDAAIAEQASHRPVEVTLRRLDGSVVDAELSVDPWREVGSPGGAVIRAIDLSRRRAVERRLISVASHELRTPLTSLCGALSVVERTLAGQLPEAGVRMLGIAQRSVDRLVLQVDHILDAARHDSGLPTARPARCDLQALVLEVSEAVGGLAEAHGVRLRTSVPAIDGWVDERLVVLALVRLIGQAIQAEGAGGHVSLEVASLAGVVTFTVAAHGPRAPLQATWGAPEVAHPSALDALLRGGPPHLDMWLCRRAIECQGGRVWCEQTADGAVTHRFSLPAGPGAPVGPPPVAVAATEWPIQFGGAGPIAGEGVPTAPTVNPVPADAAKAGGLSILVADDIEDNLLVLQAYLGGSPHHLTTAPDGLAALARFKQGAYDVVLLDLHMPVMDGLAAARAMRAWEAAEGRRPATILALTAHSLTGELHPTREAGFDGHLAKPLPRAILLATLQAIAEGNGPERPVITVDAGLSSTWPEFVASRLEELAWLRDAARQRNWAVVTRQAQLLVTLGDAYGLKRVSETGRLIADAARLRDRHAIDSLSKALSRYLGSVDVVFREAP